MDSSLLRIGTRDSPLALWQAKKVGALLEAKQINTRLVPTKSEGDLNTTQPIYAMGIQGVFTKALDIALLENKIDLAVHSLKDVPTQLPKGLILAAVLERGSVTDVLVQTHKTSLENQATIATGSLRRKAQWLHRYPQHHMVDLRGNVQTRMDKLFSSNWEGAIFAKAGLERVELLGSHYHELDWMIPAPAQGAIGVV
ncbi:MAG: hydroxymethylbilane synthase, partial [Flavobacteriia bacterium]|nr:hydroxymethylbilane synthase [Flavobacteriia bacterium]